jgi:hypothetical protein
MQRVRTVLWVGALGGLGLALACGPFDELPTEDPPPGRVCYADSDCVPNACCGTGTGAVHRADGPDCAGVVCSGQCPANQIDCGCAMPYCRDGRCSAAVREECL